VAEIVGSVGLMLDIAGAFWLARGLMTLPEHIIAEASDKGAV